MFGRPGESVDDFTTRCLTAANDLADKETAALRDKYADKVTRLQTQIQAAEDRAEVLDTERKGRRSEEMLSTAGSILGGLLGGRRSRGGMLGSILGKAGSAAGRRTRSAAAGDRLDAAENKLEGLHRQLEDLETELTQEVTDIDAKWMAAAKNVTALAGRPGAHRREGHPARPGLDPGAVASACKMQASQLECRHACRHHDPQCS